MNPNMRCHLKGKFVAQDLKDGTWRLSRGDLEPAEVLLRGADSHAPEVLASPTCATSTSSGKTSRRSCGRRRPGAA